MASHVRLFKKAQRSLRSSAPRASEDPSSSSKPLADLEALFFDAEVTMEGAVVCRDLPCTIAQEEINYLQDVADLLLFLLLPKVRTYKQAPGRAKLPSLELLKYEEDKTRFI